MYDPANPISPGYLRPIEAAAPSLGMQVSAQAVHNPAEIEAVLDAQARALNGGVIVLASPLVETDRKQIIALAAKHRLPAIYHFREYVEDGRPTGLTNSTSTAAQQPMSIASSRATSRVICRYNLRPRLSWRLTSRPPKPSASPSRKRFSRPPTR